jgi:hypothetical protein
LIKEPLAPEADHVAPDGERIRDVVIRAALCGKQDEAGPQHLKVRQRILAGAPL